MDDEEVAAVSAVVCDGSRFLLVRRGRPPSHGLFAFPGGRVEAGEGDEEAVRRELLEETGLEAGKVSPLREMRIGGDDGRSYRLKVFRVAETRGAPCAGDDAVHLGWYSIEEMRALPVTPSTLALAEEIARATGLRRNPFAATRKR